jgi:catechol 2,3-dioxygenase-like lactoylglutathione lyase family enzyme
MNVSGLDHLVINVSDVERSLGWYTGLLGLVAERVDEWRAGTVPFPSVRIDAGCIIDVMAIERTGQNIDHLCLVVDRADVDAVSGDPRFDVVAGPVERWGAKGVGWSVYVTDPDGNTVELRSYD